jgi:O-antigen ligase
MSKRNLSKPDSRAATPPQAPKAENWYALGNLVPLLICLAYLAVNFVPDFDAYDAMGPQWIYILLVDFAVIIYILANKSRYENSLDTLLKNTFARLFLAFFLVAGLSAFIAINPTESWVCYVRLIASVVAFINLGVILSDRPDIFNSLAQLIALMLLLESVRALSLLAESTGEMTMSELIHSLKGTTGNKNIFSAGLIVKIPFVLYCLHTGGNLKKALNIGIFFLGSLVIYLANARAAYLSLLLISILYGVFCVFENRREKNTERLLYRLGRFIVPLVAALFVSQVVLSSLKNLDDNKVQQYGSVTSRLATIDQGGEIRLQLWAHAADYTLKHPLMGCGYGNWKIASIPYIRVLTDDLYVPVHAHNDFLEAFAELGIIGGALYLSLFVCILVFTIKTLLLKADTRSRLISVFTFFSFAGYSVDAFFNFPMERPVNQVYFVLLTALNALAYTNTRPAPVAAGNQKKLLTPVIGLTALLLMLPSAYVMYRTYQSLVIQRVFMPDLEHEPLQLKWQELFPKIPSIPNLSASSQPLDAIKGRYLSEAGRYDEALVLLNRSIAANPTIAYSDF